MAKQDWDSVAECLAWIKEQNDPKAELMRIIGEGIEASEAGFTVELLEAYFNE